MTVRKGVGWGLRRVVPVEAPLVPGDAALHDWVATHRLQRRPIGDVAIGGGDLARTLAGATRTGAEATYVPLDVVRLVADDEHTTWSASHVVARRSWWRGEVLLAMNTEFLGAYDVAPRAHPNDGLVDVIEVAAEMPWRARMQARDRARRGAHLPHPQLTAIRVPAFTATFARPLVVWVDGERWRQATRLELTVEPDAYSAYL